MENHNTPVVENRNRGAGAEVLGAACRGQPVLGARALVAELPKAQIEDAFAMVESWR